MNGEMVATSSSASREVALEKTEWLRKVTSGGWEMGSPEVGTAEERGVPHCKLTQPQELCIQTPDQHQEGRGPSSGRERELCFNKVLQHLQTVILQGEEAEGRYG